MADPNTPPTSSVFLVWTIRGKTFSTTCSGVVFRKENNGLFIISTCHQMDDLISPNRYSSSQTGRITVKVTFFDGITSHRGKVIAYDRFTDVAVTKLVLQPNVLSSPPIFQIIPAVLTSEPVYKGQDVYTSHNPAMDGRRPLLFQKAWGKIIEPDFIRPNMPRRVHFDIPLVMCGSSGAPIYDTNSQRLVGLVCGNDYGTTANRNVPVSRLYAISRESIMIFLAGVNF